MDRLVTGRRGSAASLAVYTTVYPAALPYLEDWARSVRSQTDDDFTLWLALDGVSRDAVEKVTGRWKDAEWLDAPDGTTPAQVREWALRRVVAECDAVVLVDCDDVLLPSRVSSAREAVAGDDIAACGLRLVDAAGADMGVLFGPDGDVDISSLLPRYNVFGLSNTVYQAALLRQLFPIPSDCIAVDWLLATRAWSKGASLRFDRSPRMAYRQHPGNTARLLPPFDVGDVERATRVVARHYRSTLDAGGWDWPPEYRALLDSARERFETFRSFVSASPVSLAAYVTELNRMPIPCVWWSCVANAELEWQWKN